MPINLKKDFLCQSYTVFDTSIIVGYNNNCITINHLCLQDRSDIRSRRRLADCQQLQRKHGQLQQPAAFVRRRKRDDQLADG